MSFNCPKLGFDNIESYSPVINTTERVIPKGSRRVTTQCLKNEQHELKPGLNREEFWRRYILNRCHLENNRRYIMLKNHIEKESNQSVERLLLYAIGAGVVDIANVIIDHNPDVVCDEAQLFLVRICSGICNQNQNIQILDHLLKSGVDPNTQNHIMTPLVHLVSAVSANFYEKYHADCYYYMEFDHDVTSRVKIFAERIRNFNRVTIESINLLVYHGANLFTRDRNGKLAKDYARTIDIYLHLKILYSLALLKGGYFSLIPSDLIKYHMIKFISDEIINSL